MSTITEKRAQDADSVLFICDFSPPRGPGLAFLDNAIGLNVDFISVAYNPGKSVRVDSAMLAYYIKEKADRNVIVTLATRDMSVCSC